MTIRSLPGDRPGIDLVSVRLLADAAQHCPTSATTMIHAIDQRIESGEMWSKSARRCQRLDQTRKGPDHGARIIRTPTRAGGHLVQQLGHTRSAVAFSFGVLSSTAFCRHHDRREPRPTGQQQAPRKVTARPTLWCDFCVTYCAVSLGTVADHVDGHDERKAMTVQRTPMMMTA
jgi:hypothetical protein